MGRERKRARPEDTVDEEGDGNGSENSDTADGRGASRHGDVETTVPSSQMAAPTLLCSRAEAERLLRELQATVKTPFKRRRQGDYIPLPPFANDKPEERKEMKTTASHEKNAPEKLPQEKTSSDIGAIKRRRRERTMEIAAFIDFIDARITGEKMAILSEIRGMKHRKGNAAKKVCEDKDRLARAKDLNVRLAIQYTQERRHLQQRSAENASKRQRLLEEGAVLDSLLAENEAKKARVEAINPTPSPKRPSIEERASFPVAKRARSKSDSTGGTNREGKSLKKRVLRPGHKRNGIT